MSRFRKKPVVIEAVQYLGNGNTKDHDVPKWMWEAFENKTLQPTNGCDPLYIKTLEGDHLCSPGDWIIRGTKGELYPCKPDIFAEIYEPVEDQP
ncbi:MAG TPA: hypothetical protein VGR19_05925 [Allosphingosinicella sp.]|nr:hypothetical protein [Allosphingosinicella sp.]